MNVLSTLRFILSHPFNRGRPINALACYFSWQLRCRIAGEVKVDWIAGKKLIARRRMTGATGNIYCGLHEYRDMLFVLHALRPGDLFVDVGANIGSYTLLASGVCGSASIAIEPDAGTAKDLVRNIEANGLQDLVDVQITAVGDKAGAIAFTLGQDTMNKVASPGDTDVQMVNIARLDDLLQGRSPVIIKLDIEGYETFAMRGAVETLAKPSLLAILLETVDSETLAILEGHGFESLSYDPWSRRLVGAGGFDRGSNALFVRSRNKLQHRLMSAPHRTYRGRTL